MNTVRTAMVQGGFVSKIGVVSRCIVKIAKTAFKVFGKRERMSRRSRCKIPFISRYGSTAIIVGSYSPVIGCGIAPVAAYGISAVGGARNSGIVYYLRSTRSGSHRNMIAIGASYIVPVEGCGRNGNINSPIGRIRIDCFSIGCCKIICPNPITMITTTTNSTYIPVVTGICRETRIGIKCIANSCLRGCSGRCETCCTKFYVKT